ncbi:MAG: response regulator transcription factor [Betaproteobacteria bacterium]|jgi:two-component system response regulator FimZ (fimbrial Z protein)/two-component system response regulator EvgA
MITRILLADDHPAMLLALKGLLENQITFSVVGTAHDGDTCLSQAKDLLPDLIILDLDMPKTDGFDLIRRLKIILPNIRLLILSSLEERVYGGRVRSLGGHGYINKTVSGHIILTACVAVSQGYSFFSTAANGLLSLCDDEKLNLISDREFQVLKLLGKGMPNHEISKKLHISNKTVATYKSRLYEKLGVSNIADLINFCRENKVCDS